LRNNRIEKIITDFGLCWEIVRRFTNIKRRYLRRLFRKRKVEEIATIVKNIVEFNTYTPTQSRHPPDTSEDIEKVLIGIVDRLCNSYGWTIEYVLERISVDFANALIKAIQKRENIEGKIQAGLYHSPKKTLELLDEQIGIYTGSAGEIAQRIREKKNERKAG